MFRSYKAIVDRPGDSMPESLAKKYCPYHIIPSTLTAMLGARPYSCQSQKLFENRIASLERIGCKVERKFSFVKEPEDEARANARAVLTWLQ